MGLFDKFDNIYNTNISASQVCNMKVGNIPYELYGENGRLRGYFWHYGDTVELHFLIDGGVDTDEGTYVTAEDFLVGKSAEIIVYNFRREPVLKTVLDASTDIKLIIDYETSRKLLKGTYTLVLNIFKYNEGLGVQNESIYIPIVSGGDCILEIK